MNNNYTTNDIQFYISACGGVGVCNVDIFNNKVCYFTNCWSGSPRFKKHTSKLYNTASDRYYFICNGFRCYVDEAIN